MSAWSRLPTRSVLNACHRHAAPHQVLQRLRVHPGSGLVAAVGVAAYMGSDVRQLQTIDLVVPVHHIVEAMLPVHRNQGHPLIVQIEETGITIDHFLQLRCSPILKDRLEAPVYFFCHRQLSFSGTRFRLYDLILHPGIPLQLMVDVNDPFFHIQVSDGKPAELGNPHPCVEKDVNGFVGETKAQIDAKAKVANSADDDHVYGRK